MVNTEIVAKQYFCIPIDLQIDVESLTSICTDTTSSECETFSDRPLQLTKFLHTSLLSLVTMKHHAKPLTSSNIIVKSVLQPQLNSLFVIFTGPLNV